MADQDVNSTIDRQLAQSGLANAPETQKRERSFKVIGDSKIPVAKSHGKLWKSRVDLALNKRKMNNIEQAWDEAIAYYKNDQMEYRNGSDGNFARNRNAARRITDVLTETENLVFANISSMVPAIYAKNPEAEITVQGSGKNEEMLALKTVGERLLARLASMDAPPGFKLKPKARKAVVMATLTNTAWMQIGYTHKEASSEVAMQDIIHISEELQEADTPQDIEHLEGELMAIHERIDLLQPSGPWVKFRRPSQVVTDPAAEEGDGTDGAWMCVFEFLPTAFIRAVYATETADGEYSSIYKPTHIMKLEGDASEGHDLEDEVNNFTLIDGEEDYKKYGFTDQHTFEKAQMTKVSFVFDKTTRRVFLFNALDWTWPIWVWDDPYKLDRFFPLYKLEFYTDPESAESKGEVTYYLDQQDAINEVNDEVRRARSWAKKRVIYNSDLFTDRTQAEAFIKGDEDQMLGLALGTGADAVDANKAFAALLPPSMHYRELFDKADKYQAIDRISSTNEIARGGEFKTNTTNRAIEQYNTFAGVRLEEKTDSLEDWLGNIFWGVLQLCLQFMPAEQVEDVIGDDVRSVWRNMTPKEIQRTLSIRVVGGSSAKPTSRAKKEEAIKAGQVLGQFASAAPAAIIVAMQVMERAFDEIVIKEEDWQAILASMQQSSQQGQGGPQGGQPQGQGAQPQGQEQLLAQLERMIDTLPQQAKQALGTILARGVPVREAVARIAQMLGGNNQGNANG